MYRAKMDGGERLCCMTVNEIVTSGMTPTKIVENGGYF